MTIKQVLKTYEEMLNESFSIKIDLTKKELNIDGFSETFSTNKAILKRIIEEVENGTDNIWDEELKDLKGATNE